MKGSFQSSKGEGISRGSDITAAFGRVRKQSWREGIQGGEDHLSVTGSLTGCVSLDSPRSSIPTLSLAVYPGATPGHVSQDSPWLYNPGLSLTMYPKLLSPPCVDSWGFKAASIQVHEARHAHHHRCSLAIAKIFENSLLSHESATLSSRPALCLCPVSLDCDSFSGLTHSKNILRSSDTNFFLVKNKINCSRHYCYVHVHFLHIRSLKHFIFYA